MGVMKRLQYQQQHFGRSGFARGTTFRLGSGQLAADLELEVQLLGTQQLVKSLKQFDPVLRKKLQRRATRKAAKPVQESAKSHVPVRTGQLRKGIVIRSAKRKRSSPIVGATVVTPKRMRLGISDNDPYYYPTIVEFGAPSRNIPARPYMRPAIEENKTKVKDIYSSELKRLITETASQLRAGAITEKGVKVKS